MTIEDIAQAAHEVNRTYCAYLGDTSQAPWSLAPEWQRESAVAGVRAVIDGTVTTPEQQHEGWRRHKEADGWRYGPTKDPRKKLHPCMVPYKDLPAEQQAKDTLFRAVVEGMRHLL